MILCYRYLIKFALSEKTVVAVHCLTAEQHDVYIKTLQNDADICAFSREYLHEYDVEKLYQVETFKKEEKNETL